MPRHLKRIAVCNLSPVVLAVTNMWLSTKAIAYPRFKLYKVLPSYLCSHLRKKRTNILHSISKRLKEVAIEKANSLAEEISASEDSSKMFQAAKLLKARKPPTPIMIQDVNGSFVLSDKSKVEIVRKWFQQQFTDSDDEPIQPFTGEARPLQTPITTEEVSAAISSLKNRRAAGPDNVNNELFKFSKDITSGLISQTINESFKQHKPVDTIGEGILIAIPKPKKPKGPPANLRPIVLLNSIRKILSIIILHRIRDKIDSFTGPFQSGFKRGRSCADIVWAQRMLVSVVMARKWDFHKMGIDMSKAFDTIKRKKILQILDQAGCDEDELRLTRALLAGTKLYVRINNEMSANFETTIGSPQGDSLSPILFTCYLSAALSSVREQSSRPNPPISDTCMPLEMEYADDVEFLDEERQPLDMLQSIATKNLKNYNLFMNETKTEFTHIFLADTNETDTDSLPIRGNEKWRTHKLLGSLLCSTADVKSRCNLGNVAFRSHWKLWSKRSRIPLQLRLRLYNAYCIPIMIYNCNSWSVTKASLERLDACHRRHLRVITGHTWPNSLISNKNLYKICNSEPLSCKISTMRWNMFGHILRLHQDSPPQKALEFAIIGSKKYQGRTGRHRTNLLQLLRSDIRKAGLGSLLSTPHLHRLQNIAKDKTEWRSYQPC